MKRTKRAPKVIIPDAINKSTNREFTQVPNKLIRDPNISAKAKTVLCILLSNQEGWRTYTTSLKARMKEGLTAINTAVDELRDKGYLLKIRYRDKESKKIVGSFWAYTDTPGEFIGMEETEQLLSDHGLEMLSCDYKENHVYGNHDYGNHIDGNQSLIILDNKKTKDKKNLRGQTKDSIKISQFGKFWKAYPKKTDKGKAHSKWIDICQQKSWDPYRPTLKRVLSAIHKQKKTERWSQEEFIPHPTTWLNQKRWLDDPSQMKVHKGTNGQSNTIGYRSLPKDHVYRNDGEI